jgi:hypothetical protein
MSTVPPPPDGPTEPLTPAEPAIVDERLPAEPLAAADPLAIARFADALRSLRTAVVLLGLLSVAALGVAIYALVKSQEADQGSASSGRVATLDDRVDKLSRDLQRTRASTSGTADESDVNQVQDRLNEKASSADVRTLERTVAKLQTQLGSSDDTGAALDQVDQRLDDLSRDLRDLQAEQQTSP